MSQNTSGRSWQTPTNNQPPVLGTQRKIKNAHLAAGLLLAHARNARVMHMPVATGNTCTAAISGMPASLSACNTRQCVILVRRDEPAACSRVSVHTRGVCHGHLLDALIKCGRSGPWAALRRCHLIFRSHERGDSFCEQPWGMLFGPLALPRQHCP